MTPATAWLAVCVPLTALATLGTVLFGGMVGLTRMYFVEHDLPVTGLGWVLLLGAPVLAGRLWRRLPGELPIPPRALVLIASLAVAALAYAGVHLVFERHALSGDELMAAFDTAVFRTGALAAEVPTEWRPFVPALQPIFRLDAPGDAWWISAYLPVNAMLRAMVGRLFGDPALAGPLWSGLSVALVYAIGRRWRPDRPALALAAALLLATSSQLLITGMTPYAMSAHLALNLLWLWLLSGGGRAGHLGAAAVAFAATGLHQLIFHPLFATPFVLRLWLMRRWGAAAFHTAAYAAIGLFWASYPSLALPTPPEAAAGAGGVLAQAVEFILTFKPSDVTYTAANLLRFVVWQNPLVVPLLALSLLATWRRDGFSLALWAGLIGTAAAMAILLPFQGHGWGFRYLHGLLGSACLLAAQGWLRMVDAVPAEERRRAWSAFGLVCAAAVLILLPLRAWQTHRYVQPSAAAYRAIAAADVDVVLVDETGLWFGVDQVRNDPFLRSRPKVMDLRELGEPGLKSLCGLGRVTVFDRAVGRPLGLQTTEYAGDAVSRTLRRQAEALPCFTPWSASTEP